MNNLIVFIDSNKKQLDGRIKEICEPFDIEDKFRAFGWNACTVKGYDVAEIYDAINLSKTSVDKPSVIVLDTIKGLGVNFAEEVDFNHYLVIDESMAERGIAEIERRYKEGCYPGGDFLNDKTC
ncbi:MAG: Transketolase 1 [Firmicutes bacterium ADurb.Bin356]|nr:MAG: Transketolase 1 [Firmicutes bacterium ADurb.Bin356]